MVYGLWFAVYGLRFTVYDLSEIVDRKSNNYNRLFASGNTIVGLKVFASSKSMEA